MFIILASRYIINGYNYSGPCPLDRRATTHLCVQDFGLLYPSISTLVYCDLRAIPFVYTQTIPGRNPKLALLPSACSRQHPDGISPDN